MPYGCAESYAGRVMITFYDAQGAMTVEFDGTLADLPSGTVWIDLHDETPEETAFVERVTGVAMPSAHRLAEVEASSRQSIDGASLVMSSPVLYRDNGSVSSTPVGFVLGPELLVTLRDMDLKAFSDFLERIRTHEVQPLRNGGDAFLGLLDAIVDRMADGIEAVGTDLDHVSKRIFSARQDDETRKPSKREQRMQDILQIIGRSGDVTAQARDSLLGLNRMVGFVQANAEKCLLAHDGRRLDTIKQDIASLNEYETHLTDKVQFLLDSTLGFINIEQNRTFKLLTVASVIGIPPTFVVGLYGMNFKNMPEYDWAYGYQWGLLLVLLSIVVPVVWLRHKGWF